MIPHLRELRPVFLLLICSLSATGLWAQQFSCQVQKPPTDPAAQAFYQRAYPKAVELYAAAVKSNPKDFEAVAGEVRSLLEDQQVAAASALAENSFAANAQSAVLAAALGEVHYRQGRLADTLHAYRTSMQLDPCLARTRYDVYRILWVESMLASAYSQLQTAHDLEPDDPDIHMAWIDTLPLAERVSQIDSFLVTEKNQSADQQQSMKEYADRLRAILAGRNGGCHLTASSESTTTLPFEFWMQDAYRFKGVGFDVKVNNKAKARLELDTGASGILLNRGTAQKAGLVPVTSATISGIGDQKNMSGYWAYADDLRLGKLEFKNCLVQVSDKRSIVGIDGLIGADVFENYKVELDFPLRQMTLSPLPLRPGESTVNKASLNATGVGNAAESSASPAAAANKPNGSAHPSLIRYSDRYVSPEMKAWSPFARVGHLILINGQLKDKQPRLFLLDSGAYNSIISIPAAKSAGKLHSDLDDHVIGLSGQVKKIYTANQIDVIFAGLHAPFRNVLVMNMDGLSKDDGTEVSGIIGLDTLIMLTVDIDYRDGLVHLDYDPKHGFNKSLGHGN